MPGMPGMPGGAMPGMPGGVPQGPGGFGGGAAGGMGMGMGMGGLGGANPMGPGGMGGFGGPAGWGPPDPELQKLEVKDKEFAQRSYELAQKIKRLRAMGDRADKSKLDDLIQDLEEAVAEHFEVRQAKRKLKLKRLEEELAKAKAAIDKREKGREQIIERRIEELIGREGELDF